MRLEEVVSQIFPSQDFSILTLDELPSADDNDFWVDELNCYAGLVYLLGNNTWFLFKVDENGYQDQKI